MNSLVNSIYKRLDQLGLNAQKRALHIQFSNTDLNNQVFLQRIDGQHGLNQGVSVELICLATSAAIPLKQFIGSQVAIDQVTDHGQLFRSTGVITEAAQGQSDGALTLYKLKLEDATSLWHKRRNSRVFMNKSVVQVIETLFKEWQDKSPLFASSLSLDKSGLKKDYDIRPFIMQSNENDYAFLTRLMRSEGINWLIDEAQLIVPSSATQIQPQKLRLVDDNSEYKALERRKIRFHRSSATEQQDSITSFIGQRSLQSTAVHVQRWQADVLEQEEGAGSVQSKHQHSQNQNNASLGLEQAWHISPAWIQDLNGEDQATASNNNQIEKINQNLSHYYDAQSKQFIANSTVRDAQVGYWFELNEHPEIDQHSGSDKEFLITSKTFYNQNNLPKDLNEQINRLLQQSNWVNENKADSNNPERQANQLVLQRRNITTVPEYHPLQHRPSTHPQRAKVVGPSGEEIHVDEWGRIKVRFLFTRNENHSHDGGAGSNDNDTDSAWVDVLTPWAGEGYGARFLPRIGEIVVIDFFDGNIDRPFVVGRIHEAQRSPTKFDDKGQLPDTKKLAGIKSREVKGSGYGQLRFDDTTDQISSQLQSSHGASQLNLGNLSHPKETDTSEGRGQGFELRTDQWGALRAGQGLLLSTHAQDSASGNHLDATAAKSQLESSLNNSKALSEVAKNQQTDPLENLDHLKSFISYLEKGESSEAKNQADTFKQALMLLASPNSVALATNEDLHLSADRQIYETAGDSIQLSTQKNLVAHAQSKISLFAAQEGARLFAGKGKVEIQAQGDGADLIARKGIQIISTEDKIEIKADKKIILIADGSQVEISSAGVLPTTAGKFESKAGQHKFLGGERVNFEIPFLPSKNIYSHQFILKNKQGEIMPNTNYVLNGANGKKFKGKTDKDGKTNRIYTAEQEKFSLDVEL
jgi:type VI secretion system secreted protein VgrG